MNIALYGGSFDPIHKGHVEIARAAIERFDLKLIHFVPSGTSPFKIGKTQTTFLDRYTMVALALAGEKQMTASTLEHSGPHNPTYTVDTLRSFRKTLRKADRLFWLMGADAFKDVSRWKEPEELLTLAEFIVVSRPGVSLAEIGAALPDSMRPPDKVLKASKHAASDGPIVFANGRVMIHLLEGIKIPTSSSDVRDRLQQKKSVEKHLPPAVAEYIKKTGLYQSDGEASKIRMAPRRSTGAGYSEPKS